MSHCHSQFLRKLDLEPRFDEILGASTWHLREVGLWKRTPSRGAGYRELEGDSNVNLNL